MLVLGIPQARNLLLKTLEQVETIPVLEFLFSLGGRPVIFAGTVRDVLLAIETGEEARAPRDLDIGIAGLNQQRFCHVAKALGGLRNRYGGYRIDRNGVPPIDLWRLEDTCGLRLLGVPYSIGNVLRSFLINLNAVAFDPHTDSFHDAGCLRAIRSNQLDLVEDALIHSPATFAAKALVAEMRFSLPESPRLRAFISRFVEAKTLRHEFIKIFGGEALTTSSRGKFIP